MPRSRLRSMLNKRKALIGYATYSAGKWVVRREMRKRVAGLVAREPAARRSRRLPLIGAAVALAAAGAVVFSRLRG
jgi:hypothetical protein